MVHHNVVSCQLGKLTNALLLNIDRRLHVFACGGLCRGSPSESHHLRLSSALPCGVSHGSCVGAMRLWQHHIAGDDFEKWHAMLCMQGVNSAEVQKRCALPFLTMQGAGRSAACAE